MRQGNITKRGERSFRIKIELERDPNTGKRRYHVETVSGGAGEPVRDVRARANARLIELLDKMNKGEHVQSSSITVKGYVESWLAAPAGLSPKTAERYRQLAAGQIYPHIGDLVLQKLTPAQLQDWHQKLLTAGGHKGKPLHPRTVGHAHRVLHAALARAARAQVVFRNVASIIKPPKVEDEEVVILAADQIGAALETLKGHEFYPIVLTALGTGLRRGELVALAWKSVDLDGGALRVERSLEETKEGLRFKAPKSKAGRRTVPLAPVVVEALRAHRKAQLETRMALGLGKPADEALVFCEFDGAPLSPDKLSRDWLRIVKARKLPRVTFHALRHTHVSCLIDDGLDVLSVSRRIGHGNAALTLRTYSHLFSQKDEKAVAAVERMLKR